MKAVIKELNLNTGVGVCVIDDKDFNFNILKLQNGDQTSLYSLKEGQEIYFHENSVLNSKDQINSPYYLKNLEDRFMIARERYQISDREPLVGDLVMTSEGMKRVAKVYDDSIQLGFGKPYIYLEDGEASYSGGLDYPISRNDIVDSGDTSSALFWTFKDGARASNGIDFEMNVKVWKVK